MELPNTCKTRGGKRVICLKYVPRNANNKLVTFPIKGTIIVREKPFKTEYQIWTVDGKADLFEDTEQDLIL